MSNPIFAPYEALYGVLPRLGSLPPPNENTCLKSSFFSVLVFRSIGGVLQSLYGLEPHFEVFLPINLFGSVDTPRRISPPIGQGLPFNFL